MGMTFFLDESGSTGDVARVGTRFDFGGQPVFVLAAVGTDDPALFTQWLAALSAKHGIRAGEVKSSDLVGLPGFAADLADLLHGFDLPVFLEVVDKRFFIVANLINRLILPPVPGFDETASGATMRMVMGDLVHDTISDEALRAYADACVEPAPERLAAVFELLRNWAADHPMEEARSTLIAMIDDSKAEWKAQEAEGTEDAHLRWLPLPDESVTGRPVWMLPALSSLTNIYARINKHRGGDLAHVLLVHDEHMLFGGILEEAKQLMERLAAEDAVIVVPHADYALRERAALEFAASAASPGIQIADVIGGFVMRYVRDEIYGKPRSAGHVAAMARILRLSRPEQARGVNFVAPRRLMASLGIPWA